jgi:geranylgeranyl diphosphate synthase, type I
MGNNDTTLNFLRDYRKEILDFISFFLQKQQSVGKTVSPWSATVSEKLDSLTRGGKTLRGGLLLLSHDMFGGQRKRDAVIVASAIEMFESSVLIHDDIIDRDTTRRGMPTIHEQYRSKASDYGFADSVHYGEAMGICTGDIGLYWAVEMITGMEIEGDLKSDIIRRLTTYCIKTIYGEMEDVYFAGAPGVPTPQEILQCYRNKTSTYSFQLPLVLGSLLSQQPDDVEQRLNRLGEALGIVFQLRDDQLGLFGSEGSTGKPVGSDIREGKKTLYYYYLSQKMDPASWENIRPYFGKASITAGEIDTVITQITHLGIQTEISDLMSEYTRQATSVIVELGLPKTGQDNLEALLGFLTDREK